MTISRACSTCGYTAAYASIPRADAHHPRHSCDKHRLTLERAARRADRARSRVRRECLHADRHEHGTRVAYVKDRCRCSDCTAANTAASRSTNRERTYGRWQPFVDAGPVCSHIAALRAAGIGVERIADLAGLSVSRIRELAGSGRNDTGTPRRVRPNTAARILSVEADYTSRAPGSRIDATGTRRRLQALVAMGWSPDLLAAELGRRPLSVQRSMTSPSVTARTAQQVAALYEQLSSTPPPCSTTSDRARARAVAHGWQPPLAWDDIDTDPAPTAATPPSDDVDEIAIERALAGDGIRYDDLTSVEQEAVIRQLTDRGRSIRDIAAQLATTKRTVSRRRAPVDATGISR
jgi:hypothetical protein